MSFNGNISIPGLVSGPAAIGPDADNLSPSTGSIIHSSTLTFAGAGNIAVNGMFAVRAWRLACWNRKLRAISTSSTQTASNFVWLRFRCRALSPHGRNHRPLFPAPMAFIRPAQHVWTNNGTWLYQGFINVPNLTSVVLPAIHQYHRRALTLAYNGQLGHSSAFSYSSATTAAVVFLSYLNTLPTVFPSNAVTITGPNFAPRSNGGPFFVNFANGTAAAQWPVRGRRRYLSGQSEQQSRPVWGTTPWPSRSTIVPGSRLMTMSCLPALVAPPVWVRASSPSPPAGTISISASPTAAVVPVPTVPTPTAGLVSSPAPGTAGNNTGSGNGLIYRIDQGPNDPLGNTTNSGNAANYTVPTITAPATCLPTLLPAWS